jgi:two-component system sensor histidine kinase BaeS
VSLKVRLSAAFAIVALATALAVALATPIIVGHGFAQIQAQGDTGGSGSPSGGRLGPGPGPRADPGTGGPGPGPMAGGRAQQVRDETIVTLVAVALAAAGGASLLGLLLAGRIVRPLGQLEGAAAAVARGEHGRRSGLADRPDEIGSLGRSFDAMATEIERAELSRRRFFQDVVHELKTPLAVIDATTTAVLDGVYAHEDRHLETIRQQSRLLARIVDDLRTISLAEAGVLPLRPRAIAVDQLLAEVSQAFAARADAAGIRLELDPSPDLVANGDSDRLRQILGALLDNAFRHTPRGGRVVIESRPVADRIRVAVRDTGPGLDPQDLPHVFERFYQADQARDRSTGSSGLGLAIVKALVEAHGGSVGAENAPNGGARFWFELPAGTAPSSRA